MCRITAIYSLHFSVSSSFLRSRHNGPYHRLDATQWLSSVHSWRLLFYRIYETLPCRLLDSVGCTDCFTHTHVSLLAYLFYRILPSQDAVVNKLINDHFLSTKLRTMVTFEKGLHTLTYCARACILVTVITQLGSCLIYAWTLPAHPYNKYNTFDRLGAFFYWTRFIWQQCTVRQYHSDLSYQSALEIRVRLRVALFWHFSLRITKTSTLSSTNFTEGNFLVKNAPKRSTTK